MNVRDKTEYGVRCTLTTGEDVLITTLADDAADARRQVASHARIFGGTDAPARWLAERVANVIGVVHEARPLSEWPE